MAKPLLVGESNPYGADPYYALYPAPDGCSGHRLCTLIMGLGRKEYLDRFDRANLCDGPWSMRAARERSEEFWQQARAMNRPGIVLLGRKVATAFMVPSWPRLEPFSIHSNCADIPIIYLPHPSGLCRLWSEPGAFERARAVLIEAGVLQPRKEPSP